MKKNRYFFIVVVVLAILALVLVLANSRTTFRRALSNFAIDDTSNVTKIFMSDKNNNTVKLTKVAPGKWVVDEKYPGSKYNIEMLLGTMLQIEVKETVPKAARNNILKDMAATSVKVEIYQWKYRINIFDKLRLFPHEKLTKVYYVGGAIQSNRGSYMIMAHSSEPFVVFLPGLRGFVSPIYSPIEKYWRDYSIFKKNITEIVNVRMEFPQNPENSYLITNSHNRTPEMFSISGGQKVQNADTIKMLNFLSSFRKINFEAVLNDMDKSRKDSILSYPPYCIITVTDTSNIQSAIKTYRKAAAPGTVDDFGKPVPYDLDRLYALVNNGKDFVLIQYFVFDKVLRPKSFFLQKLSDSQRK
jgi:hypothetical protein